MLTPGSVEQFRFGSFALTVATGELFKQGAALKFQPQPFRLLHLLVSRPGELITREEIQKALWADGTTVEFDQGLNFCIRQIRAALNDDAREPRFIETLPKRGYRFIAPVEVVPLGGDGLVHTESESPIGASSRPRSRKWWSAGAAAAAILLLFFARPAIQFHAAPKAILVRPLVSLDLPERDAWFSDALTQQLVATLAETKSLRVVPWSSSMALKGQSLGVRELGRRFHVDAILEGSIRRFGDRLQVTMQLVDVASERTLWSHRDEREASDLARVQDDLLAAIAGTLKLRVTEEAIPPARRRPQNLETYNLYLKAVYLADQFSPEGVSKSVEDLGEVIRRTPGYAPAHAALANALTILPFTGAAPPKETLARAKDAALQAIALDPSLAAAHAALAHSLFQSWDWQPAETEFQTALSLDPDSAVTHQLHALYLASLGRAEDAIREGQRSVALAPTSGLISFCLSQVFLQTGHFDEAIGQSRRALELSPHFSGAYNNLTRAYTAKGMTQEALDILQQWARYDPQPDAVQPLWTAYTLARAGRKDEARRLISNWRKLRKKGLPMAYVAAVLACGDTDEALAVLHQSVERHVPSMVWLKSTPELAPIRSDRRFAQELSHMRLDK